MNIVAQITDAFRTELGRKVQRARKPGRNPWPKCSCCYHRAPSVCALCEQCPDCCMGHKPDPKPEQSP